MKKHEPAVSFCSGGLKCDNPNCDYNDISISASEYKKYVGCPCPKCGEILLTKAAYRNFKIICGIVKIVNFVCYFIPKKKLGNNLATMDIKFDGTGKPQVGPVEPIEPIEKEER